MKDLRVWFLLWLAAMVVLVALPAEGKGGGPLSADSRGTGPEWLDRPLSEPEDFRAWAQVRLNGERLHNPYRDAYPYVVASTGQPLVPLRLITEAMSGEAQWQEDERTATFVWRGRKAVLTIGSTRATLNGRPITLKQAPILWQDRTMVSADDLVRLFGARVTFAPSANEILIRRAGVLCHRPYCS